MNRYSVELRIRGKNLDVDAVTASLDLSPTYTCRRGESPNPRARDFATWGYGSGSPTRDWQCLESALNANLDELYPVKDEITALRAQHEVLWWCGCFHTEFSGGPTFSPELLKRLAEFGVELSLDCYFAEEER